MSVLTFVSGLPGLALAKGLPPRRQRAAPSLASRQQPIGDDLGPEHARRVVHVEQVDLRHTVRAGGRSDFGLPRSAIPR